MQESRPDRVLSSNSPQLSPPKKIVCFDFSVHTDKCGRQPNVAGILPKRHQNIKPKGVTMKYDIYELIDAEKVQQLMEKFYEMTNFPSTLTDPDGNVLKVNEDKILSSGWQKICQNFHRQHPKSLARCVESDTILATQVIASKEYSLYKCPNGLVDGAVPIYLDGEHIVNLFTGQFFLEPPDVDFFRKQAAAYGYDEEKYLDALREVPVFEKKTVAQGLVFLGKFAELIAFMGLKQKELLDLKDQLEVRVDSRTTELKKALDEIKTLEGILPVCSFCRRIRDNKGHWEQADVYIDKHSEADVSHGVCPACMKEHYPREYQEMLEEENED